MSITKKGDDCKMNGSFEIIKDGYPVNWAFYSPETVPYSDFNIVSDTIQYKDGKRSLQFHINKCGDSIGGWHSPGFFKEFKVIPGEVYKVSLWVINKNCRLRVKVETGMKGVPGISKTFISTQATFSEWKYFEDSLQIPAKNYNIRFEANILSPGSIWFDAIKIEGVKDKSERTLYPYRGYEECK